MIKNKINLLFTVLGMAFLSGCSISDQPDDLKTWTQEQSAKSKGKIELLPEAKSYTPVGFVAKQNPFVMKEVVSLAGLSKNKYAPDLNRRKEELELYSLDTLKMTGFLIKDKKNIAIIKSKNNMIYYVEPGNHIGTNYGLVKSVSEGEIVIEERIQEDDEWKLKISRVLLDESEQIKK